MVWSRRTHLPACSVGASRTAPIQRRALGWLMAVAVCPRPLLCDIMSDLGKIRVMAELERVTNPLLDVLEVMLEATADNNRELHGWAIMRAVGRSGPTVYGVVDRLEDAGWIVGRWEEANPQPGKPPRRLYHLTGEGIKSARELLAQRRPAIANARPRRTGPADAMGWLRRLQMGWVR